jgi:TolB-like protein
MNLYDLTQDPAWKWLSKGLADLLMTDLARSEKVRIVDREKLQYYLQELDLSHSDVADPSLALTLGRIARVQKVLSGTYQVDRENQITIRIQLVDTSTQTLAGVETVSGPVTEILDLEKTLAFRIVGDLDLPVSEAERRAIAFKWTDSLSAASHFYAALDLYDRGQTEQALAEARFASKADPSHLPSRFWEGRLYEELAEYDHAEIAIKKTLAEFTNPAYQLHLQLLLAKLYAEHLGVPPRASGVLEEIARRYPESREGVNAKFRLGELYMETRRFAQAFRVFREVATISDGRTPGAAPIPYRSVDLRDPASLKKHARFKYRSAFLSAYYAGQEVGPPPSDLMLIAPDRPIPERTGSNGRDFVAYVPKGSGFVDFELRVSFEGSGGRAFLMPYIEPLGADFSHVGQTEDVEVVDGRGRRTFDFSRDGYRAVIVKTRGGTSWRVSIKARVGPAMPPSATSFGYWRGAMHAHTKFPRILDTEDGGAGHLNLIQDRAGEFWLAYDDDNEHLGSEEFTAIDNDLWLYRSVDGARWEGPRRFARLNSSSNELMPSLLQDLSGVFRIVFVSDRTGKTQLWASESRDGRRWKAPRRIRIPIGEETSYAFPLSSPKLYQDREGRYRLAFYRSDTRRIMLTSSRDGLRWAAAVPLDFGLEQLYHHRPPDIEFLQDRTGVFRMVVSPPSAQMIFASSNDAQKWAIAPARFKGHAHPAVIQDRAGRFCLVFGQSDYFAYLHQTVTPHWGTWETPLRLPIVPYYASTFLDAPDILQDREGAFWIASRSGKQRRLNVFRLDSFPARRVADTHIAGSSGLPKFLMEEFERLEGQHASAVEKARRHADPANPE